MREDKRSFSSLVTHHAFPVTRRRSRLFFYSRLTIHDARLFPLALKIVAV